MFHFRDREEFAFSPFVRHLTIAVSRATEYDAVQPVNLQHSILAIGDEEKTGVVNILLCTPIL